MGEEEETVAGLHGAGGAAWRRFLARALLIGAGAGSRLDWRGRRGTVLGSAWASWVGAGRRSGGRRGAGVAAGKGHGVGVVSWARLGRDSSTRSAPGGLRAREKSEEREGEIRGEREWHRERRQRLGARRRQGRSLGVNGWMGP